MNKEHEIMVKIDIAKATENAYKQKAEFNSFDNFMKEVILRDTAQTRIDKTISELILK